jgi:hypothetical protein
MKKVQLLGMDDARKMSEFFTTAVAKGEQRLVIRNLVQNALENDSLYYDSAGQWYQKNSYSSLCTKI